VLRDDAKADPSELEAFVRQRIADYKCPRLVVLVEDLPHGPSGKVLRREIDRIALRDQLERTRGA
jgi:long-chain acyl-CoA synthetase